LQDPPTNSPVTQTYDATTGIYHIHVNDNTFGSDDVRPAIRFAEFDEPLPDYAKTLAFEYKATKACGEQKFVCYNLMASGKLTQRFIISQRMEITDEWITYRISVGNYRGKPRYFGDVAGQYQDLLFMDFIGGTDLQIRNIRYEDEEVPFTDVVVSNNKKTSIEAENFNMSILDGANYVNNNSVYTAPEYINPAGNRFPIYAFTSVEYVGLPDMTETIRLIQKKYQDMDAAGFTITEGSAYTGINEAALFPDRTPNGVAMDLFENTNLKMLISAGLDEADVINRAKISPRLGGYHVVDEPHYTGKYSYNTIARAAERANRIRNLDSDPNHMIFGNLFHINTQPSSIDAESYDQYVRGFVEQVKPGVISYDYYAVRMFGDDARDDNPSNESNTSLMPTFFQNMEVVSKLASYYNMKWWGFTRSMSSEYNYRMYDPESSYRYPAPREDQMRVQVFSLLAYGAQGIEYWPYVNCDGRDDALVNPDGTLNPVYY
ncbi:MAG: hypothetical protein K2M98_08080, partial [Muribaculum sp.]|nr:hypothetical protein [Muribaculum sp.]